MKRILPLVMLASMVSAAWSQTLEFNTRVSTEGPVSSRFLQVRKAPNGGFIARGIAGEQGILAKYDSQGNLQASAKFGFLFDGVRPEDADFDVDSAGNVYVVFRTRLNSVLTNVVLFYNADLIGGANVYLNGVYGGDDRTAQVVALAEGAVLSYAEDAPTTTRVWFLRYDHTGGQTAATFSENYDPGATVTDIGVDGAGKAYVVGNATIAGVPGGYQLDDAGQAVFGLDPGSASLKIASDGNELTALFTETAGYRLAELGGAQTTSTNAIPGRAVDFIAPLGAPNPYYVLLNDGAGTAGISSLTDISTVGTTVNLGNPLKLAESAGILFAMQSEVIAGQRRIGTVFDGALQSVGNINVGAEHSPKDVVGLGLGKFALVGETSGNFSAATVFGFDQFATNTFYVGEIFNGSAEKTVVATVYNRPRNCTFVLSKFTQGGGRLDAVNSSGTALFSEQIGPDYEVRDFAIRADGNPVVMGWHTTLNELAILTWNATTASWDTRTTPMNSSPKKLVVGPDNMLYIAGIWGTGSNAWVSMNQYTSSLGSVNGFVYGMAGEDQIVDFKLTSINRLVLTVNNLNNGPFYTNFDRSLNSTGGWPIGGGATLEAKSRQLANDTTALWWKTLNGTTGNYWASIAHVDTLRNRTLQTVNYEFGTTDPNFVATVTPAGAVHLAQATGSTKELVQLRSNSSVSWRRNLPSTVSKIVDLKADAQDSVYVLAEETFAVPTGALAKGWYLAKYNALGTLLTERRTQGVLGVLGGTPFSIELGRNFDFWVTGLMEDYQKGTAVNVQRYSQAVAPTVRGESYTVAVGQTLSRTAPGVLANDLDLNGDTISASLLSKPVRGTLTLNANGSFSYVAPSIAGTYSFKYRVTDSTNRSTIAQANITVTP